MARWLAGSLVATLATALLAPTATASEPGPALETPAEDLQAALACPATFTASNQPVLLVHGTATDASKWDGSYADILPPHGYDVCTVELPSQAMDDIQVASEYVVHAIRWISATSGQKVDAIGHSQGPLEIRWAIRWWPDIAELVDDVISIAGAHHGSTLLDQLCRVPCAAAAWQMRPASQFLAALNEGDETPPGPSWTSIWSQDDGAIMPPESSIQDGAANVRVQDLCPERSVDHNRLILDAVVFDLVLDALGHEGPTDVGRFPDPTCNEDLAPGAEPPPDEPDATIGTVEFFAILLTAAPLLTEEPQLAPYVALGSAPVPGSDPVGSPEANEGTGSGLPDTGGGMSPAAIVLVAAALMGRRRIA